MALLGQEQEKLTHQYSLAAASTSLPRSITKEKGERLPLDRILCLLISLIVAFSRFSKFFARLAIGSYEEWEPGKKLKILLVGYRDKLADMGVFLRQYIQNRLQYSKGGDAV